MERDEVAFIKEEFKKKYKMFKPYKVATLWERQDKAYVKIFGRIDEEPYPGIVVYAYFDRMRRRLEIQAEFASTGGD